MASYGHTSVTPLAIMSGIAGILFGIIVGYIIASQQQGGGATSVAPLAGPGPAAVTPASPQPTLVDERELATFRDILVRDPKNVRAAIELGNRLYDGGRYAEAVPYYQQAFALDPRNINVSTDLGTALWYSGRPDEALAQYAKSLAIEPTHAQTLFNMGIVRLDGKGDAKGAVEAWEKLLATSPNYPEAEKARRLLDQARQRAGTTAPTSGAGSQTPRGAQE